MKNKHFFKNFVSYFLDIIAIPISIVYYYYYYVPILMYLAWNNDISFGKDWWWKYANCLLDRKGFKFVDNIELSAVSVAKASRNYVSLILLIILLLLTVFFDIISAKKNLTAKKKLFLSIITWLFYLIAIAMVAFIKFYGAPIVIDCYYEN